MGTATHFLDSVLWNHKICATFSVAFLFSSALKRNASAFKLNDNNHNNYVEYVCVICTTHFIIIDPCSTIRYVRICIKWKLCVISNKYFFRLAYRKFIWYWNAFIDFIRWFWFLIFFFSAFIVCIFLLFWFWFIRICGNNLKGFCFSVAKNKSVSGVSWMIFLRFFWFLWKCFLYEFVIFFFLFRWWRKCSLRLSR